MSKNFIEMGKFEKKMKSKLKFSFVKWHFCRVKFLVMKRSSNSNQKPEKMTASTTLKLFPGLKKTLDMKSPNFRFTLNEYHLISKQDVGP